MGYGLTWDDLHHFADALVNKGIDECQFIPVLKHVTEGLLLSQTIGIRIGTVLRKIGLLANSKLVFALCPILNPESRTGANHYLALQPIHPLYTGQNQVGWSYA